MTHRTCGCGDRRASLGLAVPEVTAETTVEEVKTQSGALDTLRRFGIDHCCGACLPLREAAAAAGVRPEVVLQARASARGRT